MHFAILRPDPERLSRIPKQDAKKTPQRNQAHVGHDRRYIAARHDPRSNELREPVSPNILVDSDADEY